MLPTHFFLYLLLLLLFCFLFLSTSFLLVADVRTLPFVSIVETANVATARISVSKSITTNNNKQTRVSGQPGNRIGRTLAAEDLHVLYIVLTLLDILTPQILGNSKKVRGGSSWKLCCAVAVYRLDTISQATTYRSVPFVVDATTLFQSLPFHPKHTLFGRIG